MKTLTALVCSAMLSLPLASCRTAVSPALATAAPVPAERYEEPISFDFAAITDIDLSDKTVYVEEVVLGMEETYAGVREDVWKEVAAAFAPHGIIIERAAFAPDRPLDENHVRIFLLPRHRFMADHPTLFTPLYGATEEKREYLGLAEPFQRYADISITPVEGNEMVVERAPYIKQLSETIAHEIAHLLMLFHPDVTPFDDVGECTDGANNRMAPLDLDDPASPRFTRSQEIVMHSFLGDGMVRRAYSAVFYRADSFETFLFFYQMAAKERDCARLAEWGDPCPD
jgi:hypothetical protein